MAYYFCKMDKRCWLQIISRRNVLLCNTSKTGHPAVDDALPVCDEVSSSLQGFRANAHIKKVISPVPMSLSPCSEAPHQGAEL